MVKVEEDYKRPEDLGEFKSGKWQQPKRPKRPVESFDVRGKVSEPEQLPAIKYPFQPQDIRQTTVLDKTKSNNGNIGDKENARG